MQQTEDEYAQTLDDIQTRVDKRPLLLEQEQRNREIEELERKNSTCDERGKNLRKRFDETENTIRPMSK